MNFKNRKFKEIKTGNIINIIDSYENIAISDNKIKYKTNDLINTSYFEEVVGFNENFKFTKQSVDDIVDPTLFFENQSNYDNLFNKIKQMPLDNIIDDNIGVVVKGDQIPYSLQQNINTSNMSQSDQVLYETSEDDAKSELLKKYSNQYDMSNALVKKQNEALEKILDPNIPEIDLDSNTRSIVVNSSTSENSYNEHIQKVVVESPVVILFKSAKRSIDLDLSVKINNKIPRLDFIEMMEDSYEESIITWLSDSIANDIISDISDIKKQISDKIKRMIKEKNNLKDFPKKEVIKKTNVIKKESLKKSDKIEN